MSHSALENRVNELEKQVAELQATLKNGPAPNDWRRTIGMFTGNAGMLEVFQEAVHAREADRRRARRRGSTQRRAK